MYQTGDTIKNTLDQIHRHDLVLPAIQREFVWRPRADMSAVRQPDAGLSFWHIPLLARRP